MTEPDTLPGKLDSLTPERMICVLGAAVIDEIMTVPALPSRGDDIEVESRETHIGGCGLNIASALHRLNIPSVNAFLIGKGMGTNQIGNYLQARGIDVHLPKIDGDNSWCLALVEPDGERSFVTATGVENDWTLEILGQLHIQPNSLVYLSGYQLVPSADEAIVSWLESIDHAVEIVVDFGPRIEQIDPDIMVRLFALNSIVTVNRDEARMIGIDDPVEEAAADWSNRHDCPLIVRRDKDGAFFYRSEQDNGWVDSYAAEVKDTIGAGDSHTGGLLAGLSANWSLIDAIRLGNAIASYVVERTGGDCSPTLKELRRHLCEK